MLTADDVRRIVEEVVAPIKENMLTEERIREIVREELEPLEKRLRFIELSFSTLSVGVKALRTIQDDEAFDVNPIYGYTGQGINNTKLEQKTPW